MGENPLGVKMAHPCNSAQGWNIKNRLDDPKSMHQISAHTKFHVYITSGLGCRGGGLGEVTFSNMVYISCTRSLLLDLILAHFCSILPYFAQFCHTYLVAFISVF